MDITQYLSPREQHALDEATAELNSFMLELFKDDQKQTIIFDRDILFSEDDESRPTKPKAKRTKKPKLAPSKPDAPQFFSVKSETRTTDPHSETARLNKALDAYQERLVNNAKDAEVYYPINVAPFAGVTRTQAVIDWFDLRFTVDPTMCKFYKEPSARSRIKEFITKRTGIRHYLAPDESHIAQDDTSFTIRLHDISNRKDLKAITDLLTGQYGAKREAMTIEAIELSFDFYDGDSSAIVIKLHKALQYPVDAKLFRTYKFKRQDIPTTPHRLYDLIKNGYNIGMGDHRNDVFCVRVYFKRTDKGGQPLPIKEHRARIEVTLHKSIFINDSIDLHLNNLPEIIAHGFEKMQFTKLSKRAKPMEKDTYFTQVKPFGQEQVTMLSMSGHKRNLPDSIGTYSLLNSSKSSAVKNLKRKF